jgi:two-component system, sensor histidine kinase and response regulator
MSHELRTPLNAIIGFTGTLLMKLPGPLTVVQEKQLTTVQASARHLLTIINELLDLARVSTGQVTVTLKEVFCCDAVEDIVTTMQPFAKNKGLEFFIKPFPSGWSIKADLHILRQILINLINNAIKFTEKGSVWLEVSQQQIENQRLLAISIFDTGIGIKKEDQPRLFQPFETLHNLPQLESTGLGLHLSQKLAALINGRLEYQSEYGKGSCFTIVLPCVED